MDKTEINLLDVVFGVMIGVGISTIVFESRLSIVSRSIYLFLSLVFLGLFIGGLTNQDQKQMNLSLVLAIVFAGCSSIAFFITVWGTVDPLVIASLPLVMGIWLFFRSYKFTFRPK